MSQPGQPAEGPAAERTSVEHTGLAWGVRASFRRYVRRVALGSENVDEGAGMLPDGRVYFPVAKLVRFDSDAMDAEVEFTGGVHFFGHAGMIDLRLGEFRLAVESGEGMLRTSAPEGIRDLVEVRALQVSAAGAGHVAIVLESRLAPGAESLFDGVYAPGADFDELEVRLAV